MSIRIQSETGALQAVIVHRPGVEIARMTQHDLDKLLFDDLLSPSETADEHAVMTDILADAGAEVFEVAKLLATGLARAPEAERFEMLRKVGELAGSVQLAEALVTWEPEVLAEALIGGVHWRELSGLETSLARIRASQYDPTDMALRPIPNLMFMRDPCIAIGDRVVSGQMAHHARAREPALVGFAVRHGLGKAPEVVPVRQRDDDPPWVGTLEGGDVLVLSEKVLMVGSSERSSPQGVERLAESMFAHSPALERVYAVMLPERRSVMHLDTVLTQIDQHAFLGHRPMIAGQGGDEPVPVARISRGQPPEFLPRASVHDVLREELGSDVRIVACGGDDPLHQEREQWTDGANAVCVSPGHIVLYSRNVHTARALEELGFKRFRLSTVQSREERRALVEAGMREERALFAFTGSELSRARGGGRCLTMPIRRA